MASAFEGVNATPLRAAFSSFLYNFFFTFSQMPCIHSPQPFATNNLFPRL